MLSYYEKIKKYFFNNLDVKCVKDNKQFWKTVKPCLTDKTLKDERITLIINEKVVSDERELVKIFNEYLSNIVSNLDIQRPPSITLHHDPALNAIKKIENHPSILEIKKQIPSDLAFPFSFRKVTLTEIINEIKNLDELKATQSNGIPTKVIKENYDIFATFITENFNNMIENSVFPDSFKQADIKPVYKGDSRSGRENCGPVGCGRYGHWMYTHEQVLWPYYF